MHHPHDHGYKDLFSHPELLRELLLSCVPEPWVRDLDFSRACKIEKSFITASQKRLESDLIWRVPFLSGQEIYLYILIEFQSSVDHFMALRILRYTLELYSSLLKDRPAMKKLPAVFPILLYNGDERWIAPENLADLIDQRISLDFIPRFRYFKIAENEFSRERLLSLKNLISLPIPCPTGWRMYPSLRRYRPCWPQPYKNGKKSSYSKAYNRVYSKVYRKVYRKVYNRGEIKVYE